MDREKVVTLARAYYQGNSITIEEVLSMVSEYCLERGKSEADTSKFIKAMATIGDITSCFRTALSWYERKYTIVKLESSPDNSGNRRILSVL